MFRFEFDAHRMDTYGERSVAKFPLSLLAENQDAAVEKARAAFCASYDGFRKKWSHTFVLLSVSEPEPASAPVVVQLPDHMVGGCQVAPDTETANGGGSV